MHESKCFELHARTLTARSGYPVHFKSWSAVFHRVLQLTNVDKCSCAAGDWHSTRQALFHGESVKPMTVTAILASIRWAWYMRMAPTNYRVANRLQQAACSQGHFIIETVKTCIWRVMFSLSNHLGMKPDTFNALHWSCPSCSNAKPTKTLWQDFCWNWWSHIF